MQFALEYRMGEVRRLEASGLKWAQLAVLMSLPRQHRSDAVNDVLRQGMTVREVRDWMADRYGVQRSRGQRETTPVPAYNADVQARIVTRDCRRMCGRHRNTPAVFEQALLAVGPGTALTPGDLTEFWAAGDAIRSLLQQFANVGTLLEQLTAAGEGCTPE